MLLGAVSAAIVALSSGSLVLALLASAAAAAGGLIFGVLTLSLTANQVATGLALTIFGIGVSSLGGAGFVGRPLERLPAIFPAAVSGHPWLRVLFGYDGLVYLSLALTAAVAWFLNRTRAGLVLRAVGV